MVRAVALLVLASCQVSGQFLRDSEITVATWNVQNYLVQNRFEDGKFLYQYPMPESRKKGIRDLILSQQPDLLFLQELGSAAFLKELQLDLKASGLDYPFSHFAGFKDARSGLALLSRVSPKECIFHDIELRRGVQEVVIMLESVRYRFFHVHLKSRYSDDPKDPNSLSQRRREILRLSKTMELLRSHDQSSVFVLLGDFNTPFQDMLLNPLRKSWFPVPADDINGCSFTYQHRSGSGEILDGFWLHGILLQTSPSARILPLQNTALSDHRFLIFALPSSP